MNKYHIVSIGISKHQDSFVPNLSYAHKDAIDFFNLVTKNVGQIGYTALLTDSEATLSKIRTALGTNLTDQIDENDYFFFFYSGHGTIAEDIDGNSLSHYIVPFDATQDISNSCIQVTYLKEVFEKIRCKSSIVLLDSCFSGGINSKHFQNPLKIKSTKSLKTFSNTLAGRGSLVFTASKGNEEALEDGELKNGLFTHCFLDELQKDRNGEQFSVVDIFTPVVEAVSNRARDVYRRIQTPTLNGSLEGIMYLPVFTEKLVYAPDIIDPPIYSEAEAQSVSVPVIDISDKKQKKLISDTILFVENTGQNKNPVREKVALETFCQKLVRELENKWKVIFSSVGGDVQKIPEAVSELEAESFQLLLLGSVITIYGTTEQMKIYGKFVSKILDWEKEKAGLVSLISTPEIILVQIITTVGILSLASDNLKPFETLIKTEVTLDYENPPKQLFLNEHIFYCRALGGNSTKVHEHIRELLKSYKWLFAIYPTVEEKVEDFELQINFLLVTLSTLNGGRLWSDYGRFYASKIQPIIHKIKYDRLFLEQVANLIDVKKDDAMNDIIKAFEKTVADWRNGGGYFWMSVRTEDFYTKEELEKRQNQQ